MQWLQWIRSFAFCVMQRLQGRGAFIAAFLELLFCLLLGVIFYSIGDTLAGKILDPWLLWRFAYFSTTCFYYLFCWHLAGFRID